MYKRQAQVGAVVVAPPAVALVVQTQGAVRRDIAFAERRQGMLASFLKSPGSYIFTQ